MANGDIVRDSKPHIAINSLSLVHERLFLMAVIRC
jgi:hypothetical protein